MGSIISAIHDDMEEYERLCKKYKEEPQYTQDSRGYRLLDCYGTHASSLTKRQEKEWEESRKSKK